MEPIPEMKDIAQTRTINIIGDRHTKEEDEKFIQEAEEKAKRKEILLILENHSVELYPDGKMAENVYAAEDDLIHFYTELLKVLMRAQFIKDKESKYYAGSVKELQQHMKLLLNLTFGEYFRSDSQVYNVVDKEIAKIYELLGYDLNPEEEKDIDGILKLASKILTGELPIKEELIVKNLSELINLLFNIAIHCCKAIEQGEYSERIKKHDAVNKSYVKVFLNSEEEALANFLKTACDLRNQIFLERIVCLNKKFSDCVVWFIVGELHLDDLFLKFKEQHPALKVNLYRRHEKWPLLNMSAPIEEHFGKLICIGRKDNAANSSLNDDFEDEEDYSFEDLPSQKLGKLICVTKKDDQHDSDLDDNNDFDWDKVGPKTTNRQLHLYLKRNGFFKDNKPLCKESFRRACESDKKSIYRDFVEKYVIR